MPCFSGGDVPLGPFLDGDLPACEGGINLALESARGARTLTLGERSGLFSSGDESAWPWAL